MNDDDLFMAEFLDSEWVWETVNAKKNRESKHLKRLISKFKERSPISGLEKFEETSSKYLIVNLGEENYLQSGVFLGYFVQMSGSGYHFRILKNNEFFDLLTPHTQFGKLWVVMKAI